MTVSDKVTDAMRGALIGSPEAAMCPARLVLEHVTSRWGVLVLGVLLGGTHRFSEVRRAIGGVSEKMLTQTLQTLERDGFVHREARPVIPPHVDYSLTELGEEAARRVGALAEWTNEKVPEVLAAREAYDAAKVTRAAAAARPSGRARPV